MREICAKGEGIMALSRFILCPGPRSPSKGSVALAHNHSGCAIRRLRRALAEWVAWPKGCWGSRELDDGRRVLGAKAVPSGTDVGLERR